MAPQQLGAGSSAELIRLTMIGVIADPSMHHVVHEFFELFKTPWEFCHEERNYDVLVCTGDLTPAVTAPLVILYAGRTIGFDNQQSQTSWERTGHCQLSYTEHRIPVYGEWVSFRERDASLLTEIESGECVGYSRQWGSGIVARIGYDLFQEVRTLLTAGQPVANATIPALELHIMVLRNLIITCGVPLIEVPPVPDGYPFTVCLTHDVDNPSIHLHKWDHTIFGFLYRALFGSLVDLVRGRISTRSLLANWAAVLKLPLVQIGFADDAWGQFDDAYLSLEKGVPSTFFIIPFRNFPGKLAAGPAPAFRAARYAARDIAEIIDKLVRSDCEVSLHGIDAWRDCSSAEKELEEIRNVTGKHDIGVRMHWLYYNEASAVHLENAGAAYDSTVGYNETVGYHAGTTQVYKPLHAARLLELPLHVMDTALFYHAHRGLSQAEAGPVLRPLIENAAQFGGCLTINWHDRSLAPERNWGFSYCSLLQSLRMWNPWFATAGQAATWFKKRRSVSFEAEPASPEVIRARAANISNDHLPGLRLRIYHASKVGAYPSERYIDLPFHKSIDYHVSGLSLI